MTNVLAYILGAVLIAYNVAARAFVLTQIWAWFIVPAFHVPTLDMYTSFGVNLVASHLAHQTNWKKGETDTTVVMTSILAGPWVVYLVAAFVRAVWAP